MKRWLGYAYALQTGPASEPVSLEFAKHDRRIDHADDDSSVERWIKSARARAEQYLGRGLFTQTWKYQQDEFTDVMALPMAGPLQSVESVKYYDASGVLQTLSASVYTVDTLSEPGRIVRAANQIWPALQSDRRLAVEVNYTVGWSTIAAIPPDIVDALYLWIGDRDEFRANTLSGTIVSEIPAGVAAMLASHRLRWVEPKSDC